MSKTNNTDIKQQIDIVSDSGDSEDEQEQNQSGTTVPNDKKKKKKKNNKKKATNVPAQSAMGKLILERQQKLAEEEARLKAIQDEEERKAREEEEARLDAIKKVQEEKERKRKARQDKKQKQIDAGTYMTKTEKEKAKKNKERLEQIIKASGNMIVDGKIVPDPNAQITVFFKTNSISNNELENELNENSLLVGQIDSNSDTDSESESETLLTNSSKYRSIVSCIMGHVDTGKTSLLDKVRGTNVQEGEAGGITQQIGATFIPVDTLHSKISMLESENKVKIEVTGLLMIDTPGHEAFTNLRSRGCAICDIAVLVVDLMHGLEPQTKESIKMLQESGTKFIIALNKIDRLYGWTSEPDRSAKSSFEIQDSNTLDEFDSKFTQVKVQLMELGINSELYWKNNSLDDTVSICPTSAITGEGICDLLNYLITYSQTQLTTNITRSNEFNCTVMDATTTEGYGSTIDVILISGSISQGDKIIVSTSSGPVETTIRQILTPPPNRESRIKSEYIHHKTISGAIGIKIVANDIAKTMAGTPLYKITSRADRELALENSTSIVNSQCKIKLSDHGVSVYASTLGSLEALVKFLQEECNPPISVSKVHIGKVTKKDVIRINITNDEQPKEYNVVLAFNVEVDEDAVLEAKKLGVQIFTAEIIYHLFDQYIKYKEQLVLQRKEEARPYTVFPCVLKILPEHVYNRKGPLIFGVQVEAGTLRIGTPLFINENNLYLGNVIGIENNRKPVQTAKTGTQVCIKVEYPERVDNPNNYSYGKYIKSAPSYGIDFNSNYQVCSLISRETINLIKEHFKDEIKQEDINLLAKLKKIFRIG